MYLLICAKKNVISIFVGIIRSHDVIVSLNEKSKNNDLSI